jgi:hypothetical protein
LPNDFDEMLMENIMKMVMENIFISTTINGDENRQCAHLYVICDCFIVGMEDVKLIDKVRLLTYSA